MRISARIALVVVAVLVLAVPASSEPRQPAAPTVVPPGSAFLPRGVLGPRQSVFYGYVRTLTRAGGGGWYRARIDPTLVLTGITASVAAVEDRVLRPGEPVPNDYYERNESARPLTFRMPAAAHVTVLVNPGTGPRAAVVPVAELVQIVAGRNPRRRPGLWGPAAGFYVRVAGDTVLALDQAYRP